MDIGGIVDQHVEPALISLDTLKQSRYLNVIAVITVRRDPFAAQLSDLLSGFSKRTGQNGSVPTFCITGRFRAASDVNSVAELS
jgi:hypothetical protein